MLPTRFDSEWLDLAKRARSVPSPGRVHGSADGEVRPARARRCDDPLRRRALIFVSLVAGPWLAPGTVWVVVL